MLAVSKVLSLERKYREENWPLVIFGASICVALLFNSTLQLQNTLLRKTIVNTKARAKQMLEYFPKVTIC